MPSDPHRRHRRSSAADDRLALPPLHHARCRSRRSARRERHWDAPHDQAQTLAQLSGRRIGGPSGARNREALEALARHWTRWNSAARQPPRAVRAGRRAVRGQTTLLPCSRRGRLLARHPADRQQQRAPITNRPGGGAQRSGAVGRDRCRPAGAAGHAPHDRSVGEECQHAAGAQCCCSIIPALILPAGGRLMVNRLPRSARRSAKFAHREPRPARGQWPT